MSTATRRAHRLERRQPATTNPDVVHGICRRCGAYGQLARNGRVCANAILGALLPGCAAKPNGYRERAGVIARLHEQGRNRKPGIGGLRAQLDAIDQTRVR